MNIEAAARIRALDARIAQEVMGIDLTPIVGLVRPTLEHYHTDIAAAWKVVQRLGRRYIVTVNTWDRGTDVEAYHSGLDGRFYADCNLGAGEVPDWELQHHTQQAICNVALQIAAAGFP